MRLYLTKFVFIIGAVLLSSYCFAQTKTITGKITDSSNEPLIGATVQIKGTGQGRSADFEGNFTVEASAEDILVFSYLGYTSKEIAVGEQTVINVVLSDDLQKLDEVVVVGFGTSQKRFVTGALSKVDGEVLANRPISTVDAALQGQAAGVQVTTSDGSAGASVTIRVRGTSSIQASSEPLYVVDGIPIVSGNFTTNNASGWQLATASESNALQQINPSDIESIEILKDASATAIYGSRGANGVVLITTKSGKEGKTKFNVGYYSGITEATNRIEMLDGSSYLELAQEAWTNSYNDDQNDNVAWNDDRYSIDNDYEKFWNTILPDGLTREKAQATNTNWIDQMLRQGMVQEANVSVSGGTAKTTFYIGGTFRDEKGILVGNDFRRYNARINLEHQVSDKIKIGTRTAFTSVNRILVPVAWAGGLGIAQSQALPFWPILNDDGTYFNAESGLNPVAEINETDMNQRTISILGNVYAQIDIAKGLSFRSEFGINNVYNKEQYYRSAVIRPDAIATAIVGENENWNTNNILNYSIDFSEKHHLEAMIGFNATKNSFFANTINGSEFANPALTNPTNASVKTATVSVSEFSFLSGLARLNYRYDDKFLVSISARRDGSSRFGNGSRWGTFPAASLGYILSEEPFLADNNVLTYLKLRGGAGITGNAEIGNYEYFGAYTTNTYVDRAGLTVSKIDNPNLGWETTTQYNGGIDFGLWEGRIQGSVDYYYKYTEDLLIEANVSSLTGTNRTVINAGTLENEGVELSLTSYNLSGGKLTWNTTFNISYNRNKVLDLGDSDILIPAVLGAAGPVGEGYAVSTPYTVPFAGIAASDMILTVTDPGTGSPMDIQVRGGDELYINQFGETTNIYSNADRVFMGNAYPFWTGGLTNNLSYKNFDFSFLFTFALGHQIDNAEQMFQYRGFGYDWTMLANATTRWQNPGDVTQMQRLTWSGARQVASSRYLYDADFVRLKDVTLSYNFGKAILNKWKIDNARVFVRGTNLLTFTSYEGWDPEYNRDESGNAGQSKSWLPSPQAKSVVLGVNFGF